MAKEPSTSEGPAKSLHVVCAPGGGAFSVYMFLRYTLAQLSDPQISEVKMTMFCRKKKGKPFDAEIWWKRWSNDKTLTGTLSFPSGWKPLFVDSIQASNETTIDEDIPVFILAGGDRASLVDVFQQTHLSNQNATLKTEHEIVILEENSFFFHSAYDGQILTGTDTALPLSPEEAIHAVESAKSKFSLMRRVTKNWQPQAGTRRITINGVSPGTLAGAFIHRSVRMIPPESKSN